MGILGEFLIIAAITAAGTLISYIPGFPFPGSVTGMILMLLFLLTGTVKLKHINNAAGFFTGYLPMFFIPLIVNLINESELIGRYGIKLLAVILSTSIITLTITGLIAKILIKITYKKGCTDA